MDANNDQNMTDLMKMAASGDIERCEYLLQEDPHQINFRDIDGKTALMHAVTYGESMSYELLLSYGADLSLSDNQGNTALFHAALSGNMNMCQKIISENRRFTQDKNAKGDTVLHYACRGGHFHTAKYLVSKMLIPDITCYNCEQKNMMDVWGVSPGSSDESRSSVEKSVFHDFITGYVGAHL